MKINRKLLPIKLHYFFFMAAMGPILPQLPLFGKDLGVSSIVMGTVTGILPLTFLLTKPIFGLLIDVYRQYRKMIFLILLVIMSISYAAMYFIPSYNLKNIELTNFTLSTDCDKNISRDISFICNSSCLTKRVPFAVNFEDQNYDLCPLSDVQLSGDYRKCKFICTDDKHSFYQSFTFWTFIILMSVGTIGFNVINSLSDAICFDIVENQGDYGNQRLWGSVGFGVSALIAGCSVDLLSTATTNYEPAFITMVIFTILDLVVCAKLKLPIIEAPKNICRDLKILLSNCHVITFIIFTVLAGMLDGLIIYFLFWYLEDLAAQTDVKNIKLIEGLILAAGTLGAEVIFFSVSGKILQRLGHVNSFTLCFFNYALRLGFISVAPSPWWILPVEFLLQGPTFALTYTAIVAYANKLAPPGMSATMQGIAAGMGDGTGYAIGSTVGGLFYRYLGGKNTFQVFTGVALLCAGLHFILHKTVLKERERRRFEYEEIC